jgi:UDP-GlcNAc:undecaprenyl-phosphate GlcNAc-1-phosphate transferase
MLTYLVAFLIALGLSTALIPTIKSFARRYRLFDRNLSSRKIHTTPIPRLGGVAIAAGFYAPLLGLLFHENQVAERVYQDPRQMLGLLVGGLLVFGLGLYDDLKGAGARLKFTVQVAVAIGMYAVGYRVEILALPFVGHIALGIFAAPFTVLWIVGVINAFNLVDGLDGLAGGVAFFAVTTVFVLALSGGDVLMSLYMAALAGGILGFLIFNFNPASIFMGDSGSMFLGFVLAATSIQTSQKRGTAVAILIPIVSLGLPIMDTLLAMARRFVSGRSMFRADREHIHHRLLAMGFTHRRAVILLYALCMFLGTVAVAMTFANSAQQALLLLVVAAVVAVLVRKLYLGSLGKAPRPLGELRERNLMLRSVVRDAGERLRGALGRDQVWQCVLPAAPQLDVRTLKLELREHSADGTGNKTTYSWEQGASPGATIELRLPVGTDGRGELLVGIHGTSVAEVDRDQEIALEILCEHLTAALDRIDRENGVARTVVPFRR